MFSVTWVYISMQSSRREILNQELDFKEKIGLPTAGKRVKLMVFVRNIILYSKSKVVNAQLFLIKWWSIALSLLVSVNQLWLVYVMHVIQQLLTLSTWYINKQGWYKLDITGWINHDMETSRNTHITGLTTAPEVPIGFIKLPIIYMPIIQPC